MVKIVLFALVLLVIGVTGIGCLEEPTYHKMLTDVISNQQTIINKQVDIDKEVSTISGMQFVIGLAEKDRYEELNAKLDKLISGQCLTTPNQPAHTISPMLYQPNPQIFVSIYNGDTRTSKLCNNIDEAITFINTFR